MPKSKASEEQAYIAGVISIARWMRPLKGDLYITSALRVEGVTLKEDEVREVS